MWCIELLIAFTWSVTLDIKKQFWIPQEDTKLKRNFTIIHITESPIKINLKNKLSTLINPKINKWICYTLPLVIKGTKAIDTFGGSDFIIFKSGVGVTTKIKLTNGWHSNRLYLRFSNFRGWGV